MKSVVVSRGTGAKKFLTMPERVRNPVIWDRSFSFRAKTNFWIWGNSRRALGNIKFYIFRLQTLYFKLSWLYLDSRPHLTENNELQSIMNKLSFALFSKGLQFEVIDSYIALKAYIWVSQPFKVLGAHGIKMIGKLSYLGASLFFSRRYCECVLNQLV